MNIRSIMIVALATTLVLSSKLVLAADPVISQEREQTQGQVYGRQLMTEQERTEKRSKMRAAKTAEEREQIRTENHERMKERAKKQGVTLTDEPPSRGGGMGFRNNMKSKGKAMGAGGGRSR